MLKHPNLKYIQETESLVSQTKMFLKDLFGGQVDFDILNDQLEDIQTELESDCNVMKGEINTLKAMDENIEKQITLLQKEEENGSNEYKNKINSLKNELESKEFTIQNMERLYIELEDVIKDNIQKGNEQFKQTADPNNTLDREDIHIYGHVFGGGEANEAGSEIYDWLFISVTQGTEINVNAQNYSNFAIDGSFYGGGNASSASGDSYLNIYNYHI